ncbi:MAG: hypothetical protein L6R40_005987 [Gallowayella cf. fulva]|nr:MAG: hypothetical protein L6R40_005987 [Xanthomendoza cf. fulva]
MSARVIFTSTSSNGSSTTPRSIWSPGSFFSTTPSTPQFQPHQQYLHISPWNPPGARRSNPYARSDVDACRYPGANRYGAIGDYHPPAGNVIDHVADVNKLVADHDGIYINNNIASSPVAARPASPLQQLAPSPSPRSPSAMSWTPEAMAAEAELEKVGERLRRMEIGNMRVSSPCMMWSDDHSKSNCGNEEEAEKEEYPVAGPNTITDRKGKSIAPRLSPSPSSPLTLSPPLTPASATAVQEHPDWTCPAAAVAAPAAPAAPPPPAASSSPPPQSPSSPSFICPAGLQAIWLAQLAKRAAAEKVTEEKRREMAYREWKRTIGLTKRELVNKIKGCRDSGRRAWLQGVLEEKIALERGRC